MDTRQKDGADFPSVNTSHLEYQPKTFRLPNLLSSHGELILFRNLEITDFSSESNATFRS